MNTYLDENKIFVLWQVPVLLAGLAMLFVLGPWLIARSCRTRGVPVPSLANRLFQSLLVFFALIIGLIVSVLFFGGLPNARAAIIVFASGLVVLGVFIWAIVRKQPKNVQFVYGLNTAIATLAIIGCSVASSHRSVQLAIRARDAMNLNAIGKALLMYNTVYPTYPPDLRILVDMNQPAALLVATKGSKEKDPPDKPYTGPCDYKYIPQAAEHADLIWAWLPAKFYNGEVGLTLYGNGFVRVLPPDKLMAEVRRTEQWVAEHPKTPPASQPATQAAELSATTAPAK